MSSTISSPGVGSGLDVTSIVTAIVDSQMEVRENLLTRQEDDLEVEISALGQLQSGLSTFQSSLDDLQRMRDFNVPLVSSSDSSIATATANSTAATGEYSLEVNSLAKAQSVATTNTAFTDSTSEIGGGTITIKMGQFNSGKTDFEATPAVTTTDINISADATLAEVRNAINTSDAGVTASIIKDDDTAYLVITGNDTGSENAFTITVSDDDGVDTDNSGLSSLVYDPLDLNITTNATINADAEDSEVVINSLTLNTSSNTLTDVIEGLTIDLEKVDASNPITLTVSNDTETAKENITNFFDEMNNMLTLLDDLMKYEVEDGALVVGDLFGDGMARTIENRIRSMLRTPVEHLSGDITTLRDLGFETEKDGSLTLNEDTLDEVLEDDYDAVANMLAFSSTASDTLIETKSVSILNEPGSYDLVIDDTQSIASAEEANFSSAGSSISSGTITIAIGTYGSGKTSFTPTTTHADITIGADSTLTDVMNAINASAAAADVTASIETEDEVARLVITGNNTGESSAFQVIVSGDGDGSDTDANGLSALAYDPTTGGTANAEIETDVFKLGTSLSATLDGVRMYSDDGYLLEGTGVFAGLSASLLGGSAGDRGTINISKGNAVGMNDLIDSYIDSLDGVLTDRLNQLNEKSNELSEERTDLEDYRERLENTYYKQYAYLDAYIAESQAISSYLTQQFESNSSDS